MAGNNDRHGVSASGRPSSADGLGCACPFGQFRIVDDFSVGNERDFAPDPLLKIGTGQAQREREFGSLSREIFAELPRRLLKNRVLSIEGPAVTHSRDVITADKIKASQGRVVGDQHEVVYWAFDDGIIVHIVSSCRCLFHVMYLSLSLFKFSRNRTDCSPFSVMEIKLFQCPKTARLTKIRSACLANET